MRKIATVLLALALFANSEVSAQSNMPKGAAAQAANSSSNNNFAWGIGLGMLVAVGIVVGVTVGSSLKNPSSFSH